MLMQKIIIKVCLSRSARYPTELIFKEFKAVNFDQFSDMYLIHFVHVRPGIFPEAPGHVHMGPTNNLRG